jgi:hypothetical protein
MDFTDFDWPYDEIHARIREIDRENIPIIRQRPRFIQPHERWRYRRPRHVVTNLNERRQLARISAQMRADNRREIRQLDREIYQGLHRGLNRVNTNIQNLMERDWEEPWSHREELIDLEIQRNNLQNEINEFN